MGCSPVNTNPVLKSYPLSNLLSESNDRGRWSITRRSEEDETVASHVPQSIRQMGTESRTAGRSSQLGSTARDSLSSHKNHLNFYSRADRLNGKFLKYLVSLVTDAAGSTRFQGGETASGYITTTAYIAIHHAHREFLPSLTLSPVEQIRATTP